MHFFYRESSEEAYESPSRNEDSDIFGSPLESPSQFILSSISRPDVSTYFSRRSIPDAENTIINTSVALRDQSTSSGGDSLPSSVTVCSYNFSTPMELSKPLERVISSPPSYAFSPPLTRSAVRR